MKRYPPLSLETINERLYVFAETGIAFWKDATKHHRHLVGAEAGGIRRGRGGKDYWVIRINGLSYKRAAIILFLSTGKWPEETVDHINGNSLDDRSANLRHASVMQNAWNHRTRKKLAKEPMGVRQTPQGKFQARLAFAKKTIHLGVFDSPAEASAAYQSKRKELYGEFA